MRTKFKLRLKRRSILAFRRDEDGAHAIEFGLIALPFFLMLFMIIELGLLFLASHMLDLGTSKASRLIRVGMNPSLSDFRNEVCDNISFLLSCDKVQIDVRAYPDISGYGSSTPPELEMDADGNFNTSYTAGNREEVQLVRVMYLYPMILDFLPSTTGTEQGRLLTSSFVFRNEPW